MSRRVLPGFRPTFALTWTYVVALVLVPLSALLVKSTTMGWTHFWEAALSPRALASYRVTFGTAGVAAALDAVFGLLVAWVLVRYRFWGHAVVDALVDLPFALPTAVVGLTLTALYTKTGWLGAPLHDLGVEVAFSRLGIVVALTFIGLPLAVRTIEPVLAAIPIEVEEVAAVMGASRLQIFARVVLPTLWPTLLTGFALVFARGVGEYGAIVFISGNMPMRTEVTPLLIVTKLEQYDYAGATALAVVLLGSSFTLLLFVNLLQRWARQRLGFDLEQDPAPRGAAVLASEGTR